SVSHDLRSPLRHIDGFVKLLEKESGDELGERGQRHLKIIAGAARQMGELIDDLLAFSRMNRTELHRGEITTSTLVHEVVESLQNETSGRRITWQIGALPDVEGDAAMLRQVWVNLIANAVKYSRPRETAVIEIGAGAATATEQVFFVRDNGVGF